MIHYSSHIFQPSLGLDLFRPFKGSLESWIPIQLRFALCTFVEISLLHPRFKQTQLPKETEEELVICETRHENL